MTKGMKKTVKRKAREEKKTGVKNCTNQYRT